MTVVADTGPLIALAKIDRLGLLQHLASEVIVPAAVHRELLAKIGVESARLDAAFAAFIHVEMNPTLTIEVETATRKLSQGEQYAIALAILHKESLVIDDRLGRQVALTLGLSVIGTAGVLIQAKNAGLISEVRSLMQEMRSAGYWLSDELIELTANQAGEGS